MAMLFCDGFDKYGPAGQATPTPAILLLAEWNNVASSPVIVAGLSAGGQAVSFSTGQSISKTLASSSGRLIGGTRFSSGLASAENVFITFFDAGTAQCSLTVNNTGAISLRNGVYNSVTVVATSGATVSANSTHYLEWDISFGAAAAYQVWLDGVSIFSGTGNTKTTANNSANSFQIGAANIVSAVASFDDLYLFDATGTSCNAPLLNNPIIETALPNSDVQKQWASGATIIGNDNAATAATNAPGANFLFLRQFTAPASMTLNSMSCVPMATAGAAKFRPVIYGPVGSVGSIGGHRYWRVNVNSVGVSVAEFQFRTTAGSPLLFSGGTASASSVIGGAATNALDNNPATTWGAAASASWWQYDYGAGVTPAIVEITIQNTATNLGNPTNFDVQYSDDGANFFTVANYTPSWSTGGQIQTFTLSSRPTVPGSPGSALIAQGNEVVGTTSGATLTATFPTPPSLVGGTAYAIGFITDTSVVLAEQDTATTGLKVANTYTSGAPALLPTPTVSQNDWQIYGNCTGAPTNYTALINNPAIDDIAYVWDATIGHEDLYGFPPLSSNPASIACVAMKARVKRSDSGSRTVDVRCASGSADTAGTAAAVTPGSSFGWVDNYLMLDPNTGSPWTGSATNAAAGGVRVAS